MFIHTRTVVGPPKKVYFSASVSDVKEEERDSVTIKVVQLSPGGDGLDPNHGAHMTLTFF